MNTNHTIKVERRKRIKKALKERISLRGICRIFNVSLSWIPFFFAHDLWEQISKNLSLSNDEIKQIKKLEVFGIRVDELWSFVQKKKRKLWI